MSEEEIGVKPKRCYCGEIEDQTSIKCQTCDRKFHFKCWQAQVSVDAICPFCRVIMNHRYNKVIG